MLRVCRPAVFLYALFACSSSMFSQSWTVPSTYSAGIDAPQELFTADLLGNQSSDVLAVSTGHNLLLYKNDGSGHLSTTPQVLISNVTAAAAGKFSGTEMDDVLAISSITPDARLQLMLMESQGARSLGTAIAAAPQLILDATCQLNTADFNGDGIPDVLVDCTSSNSLFVGINNGKGAFTFKSVPGAVANGRQMLKVSPGDLDGDGLADIVVQSAPTYSPTSTRVDVLWNSTDGTFSPQEGYVSVPDTTTLYIAKIDGHVSANLAAATSNSVSVFADQADRNALVVSSSLQVPAGCVVTSVTSGRIIDVKYSLGKDIVVEASCDGQNQLLVYPNTAQTNLTLTPVLSYNGGIPALSIGIAVDNTSGTIDPTGSVAAQIGTAEPVKSTLVNGDAQIGIQPSAGVNILNVFYTGDSNDSGASKTSQIVLAGSSSSGPSTLQMVGPSVDSNSSLSVGVPYQLQTGIEWGLAGTAGVRSPVTGSVTFTDNGDIVGTSQGTPAYDLSLWSSSDCSWNGAAWIGTQCMADGSGSYPIAYEQDQTTFTTQTSSSSAGTHSLGASFTDATYGSVSKSLDVVISSGAVTTTPSSSTTASPTKLGSVSHVALPMRPVAMAQSTTTSFDVSSNNNPSTYGQSVTFTTSYPASGNGTWNYYDNGTLLGPATVQSLSSPEGIAVNPTTNYIYVSNYGNNTVSVINGVNDYIVATVPVGANPEAIAVDSSNGYIYVANYQGSSISVISPASNSVVATIPVNANPWSIAVNPNTHTVYIADNVGTEIINDTTFTVSGTVNGGCGGIYCNIAVNPNTDTLFVSSGKEVYTVNLSTNTPGAGVNDSIYTDANASLTVNTTTNTAYIYEFNGSSGSIVGLFNGTTGSVGTNYTSPYLATYPSGIAINSSTSEFCFVSGQIFCGTGSSPSIIYSPAGTASAVAVNPTTKTFYVTNSSTNNITVISGATNTIIDTIGMTATYTTSTLTVGTHPITSKYSGDSSGNPAASSSVLSQVVNGITPSVSVSCSPNPITYGSQITSCTTTVSGGSTGTVTWTINGGAWTSNTLSGGTASAGGFAGYAAGTYTIGVTYNGDGSHNPASSSTILTINKATPTITQSCTNPTYPGSTTCTVQLNVVAGGGVPTGSVTYSDNGTYWGAVGINSSGQAVGVGGSSPGAQSETAAYSGDGNYNAVSITTAWREQKATPTMSASCSPNPVAYLSYYTCTALVSGGATGTVSWPASISGPITSISGGISTTPSLQATAVPGTYSGTVTYGGDSNNNSVSTSVSITSIKDNSAISLATSNATPIFGQGVTLTASVSGGSTGEAVTFYDGGSAIGTGTISGGTASFMSSTLSAGSHSITAIYAGDSYFNGSTSNIVAETVSNPATSTVVWSDLNPSPTGQPIQVSAEVLGNSPTGNVSFTVDGSATGSSPPLKSVTVTNLLPNSNPATWTTWGYAGFTQTLVDSNSPAPDGTNTASYFQAGGTNTSIIEPMVTYGQVQGVAFTVSVWMRADSACSVSLGTKSQTTPYEGASAGMNVTTTWQRFTFTHTYINPGTNPLSLLLMRAPGCNIYLWGGQMEAASSAGAYVPTTGASVTASVSAVSIPVAGLAPGNHQITASYSGNDLASTSPAYTQVVTTTNSLSSITSNLNPSNYGQNVTFTSQISTGGKTPTGTVSFSSDGANIGSGTVTAVPVTNLAPFSNDFANWSKDGYMVAAPTVQPNIINGPDGSTDTATEVTYPVTTGGYSEIYLAEPNRISYANQTMTFSVWVQGTTAAQALNLYVSDEPYTSRAVGLLSCNVTEAWQRCSVTYTYPSNAGTGFHLYLRVTSDSASQTFNFWGAQFEQASNPSPYVATDGAAQSGFGGIASLSTSALAGGSHLISAVYGGDSVVNASTAPSITQVVNLGTPSISASCSPNPITYGNTYSCSASVDSGATGTVTWTQDGSTWTTTTVNSGASSTGTYPATGVPGAFTIGVTYNGDSNDSPASTTLTLTSVQASQAIAFTPPSSPVNYGVAPISLTATAGSGRPVIFSVLSGPGTVSGSTLTITGVGTVVVAANQAGNADYKAATQVTQSVVVDKATPTIAWATPASITYGTALSGTQLNATSGGVAGTFSYSPVSGTVLSAGTNTLSVTFNPTDSTDYNSATGSVSLTVNKAASVFTIDSSSNPSAYGTSVTFTISGPTTATGIITLVDGVTTVGTGTLNSGVATVTIPLLVAGSHVLTASYPGDGNFLLSTSAPYTQVVNTVPVAIAIASTVNPSNYGQTVTFTFTFKGVTGGAVPTGTAQVTDGVNNLGTLTLNSSGVATFTTSALVAGTHSITAIYQGDSNYH